MKVSTGDFEIHLSAFLKEIASAMPSGIHKFGVGVLSVANARKIEEFLVSLSGDDGMIDLDRAKELIDGGFAATNGSLELNIPGLPIIGLGSVNFKITKQDTDRFFAGFSSTQNKE